jgi:hypothetical protein
MNIAEIEAVLCPNDVPWFEKESSLLARDCIYPSSVPEMECAEFHELSVPSLELEEAILEVDRTAVRDKYINRYFQQELSEIEQYNERRVAILSKCSDLSNKIHTWNAEQRSLGSRSTPSVDQMAISGLPTNRQQCATAGRIPFNSAIDREAKTVPSYKEHRPR